MRRTALVIAAMAVATAALAHSGATGIVKVRMDGMKVLGKAMKDLTLMSRAGEFDADAVLRNAKMIQNHSGEAMNERFPSGSLEGVTEAAPAIWTQWGDFTAISDELYRAAVDLEREAKTDLSEIPPVIRRVAATCSACHQDYRIKR